MITDHRNGADDPQPDLARPVRLFIPRQQIAGECESERRAEQEHAGHPGQLAGPLIGAPDEHLDQVEQQQNHHGAGAPVVDAADEPAQRCFFLDVFHTLPRSANRGCVAGGQQDAGHDLKHEHEQQQTAKRSSPARSAFDRLKKHPLLQFPPTCARAEEAGLGRRLCLVGWRFAHRDTFSHGNPADGRYTSTASFSFKPVRKSCQRTHRCPSRI